MRNLLATLQVAFLASTISAQSLRKPDNAVKLNQRLLAPLVTIPQQSDNIQEPLTAETGFPAAVSSASKYFQDVYMAQVSPEVMEFGHISETPSDWEQRFETLNLKDLTRQGKVRWGDKHGGYGEHYWDYNHAGHDDHDGGEESSPQAQYTDYEPSQSETKQHAIVTSTSKPERKQFGFDDGFQRPQRQAIKSPIVAQAQEQFDSKRQNGEVRFDRTSVSGVSNRQQRSPAASAKDDVEFIGDGSKAAILSGRTGRHGGNYRREPRVERGKRERGDEYDEAVEYEELEE